MWKLVPKNNKQTENAPLLKKKKKIIKQIIQGQVDMKKEPIKLRK